MPPTNLSDSLTALLAAIVTFAIGLSVVLRERQRIQRPHRRFALLCFNLCLWQLTSFLRGALSPFPVAAEVMLVGTLFAGVLLPINSLRFFRAFLQTDTRSAPPPPLLFTLTSLGFAVALGFTIAARPGGLKSDRALIAGLVGYVLFGMTWSMYEIWSASRRTLSRVEKTRLHYLLIGGLATLLLVGLDFLRGLGLPMPALGHPAATLYIFFLSQTLFLYRLLDLNELLGKMVVLSAVVLLLSAVYLLLVAWIPENQPGVFLFNTVVASLAITIVIDPLRTRVENRVYRLMFSEKYLLRSRIEDLRDELANIIDVREAVRAVVAALEDTRRVTHAAVYLVDQDGTGYELQGHLGPRPVERVDAAARRPFLERLAKGAGGQAVSLEQLQRELAGKAPDDPAIETLDAIGRALDEMHAGVCVPVVAAGAASGGERGPDALLGLLCFKDERLREAYATDEIDLFRALAAQMAITLENSTLYERMKERDRLAALGEMAAGLAHEIRNPLGAIKGAAQLLLPVDATAGAPDKGRTLPPNATDFVAVIVEEVNRLNRVVSQFLDFARPFRGELVPCDINDVVRRTAQLLDQIDQQTDRPSDRQSDRSGPADPSSQSGWRGSAISAARADRAVEPPKGTVETQLILAEDLPRVRADAEQLRQVFLNLAINAVQAMDGAGRLTITTALRKASRRGRVEKFVEVRFRDTGPGIPPSELPNLFIPFFTTKQKGTGLGLPISQRIVQNHGGTIDVRSRPGQGATFTVVLPVPSATE